MRAETTVELTGPPAFRPGDKVVARRYVKNDGTFAGREIGEVLVGKGDVGYVRDVGSFLQQFYVYAVEWVDRGVVVGMRAKELDRFGAAVPSATRTASTSPSPAEGATP